MRDASVVGKLVLEDTRVKRPRFTVLRLCAFVFGTFLTAFLTAILFQILYVPPRIESGWRSFAPKAEQNQLGFRGRQIAYTNNDFVIVLLGDSQVEAMALPFDLMPERLLESALNSGGRKVKVFSLGAGGYGQDQELLALEEYFRKYRADLVILWETPQNDVWNNVFPTHMASFNPKPTFWLDEGRLQGPTEALGQPLPYSRFALWALLQRLRHDMFEQRDRNWERRLPQPYRPLEHYTGQVNTEWQDRWETNKGRIRDENLTNEKSHMAITLSPRSDRMQYGLDLTRALLQRINKVSSSQGAGLLILQTDGNSLPQQDEVHVLNGKYYLVSRRQFVANWDYINQGFETDITPLTGNDWRVSPEDAHLNLQANQRVMRDLAKRIGERIP